MPLQPLIPGETYGLYVFACHLSESLQTHHHNRFICIPRNPHCHLDLDLVFFVIHSNRGKFSIFSLHLLGRLVSALIAHYLLLLIRPSDIIASSEPSILI
jgi:hypothetical protein